MRAPRRYTIVAALAVLAILIFSAVALVVLNAGAAPRVYAPAEVVQGRYDRPDEWAGRTVLVRGHLLVVGAAPAWAIIMPPLRTVECDASPRRSAVFAYTSGPRSSLIVVGRIAGRAAALAPPDTSFIHTALAALSCLPLIGQLVPASVTEQGETYRVRVLPVRRCAPATSFMPCPDALVQ